ncbi:hypothetical protein EYC80_001986 [Monilinia laxa]|uniref:Uncharacterized protein n=1 Tax=Monilinia laxa TaxID=61186 RepID=A0A5N6K6R4_MONLA|nr:hypothetical protein EYC80_001986 [Monilinia laxa]
METNSSQQSRSKQKTSTNGHNVDEEVDLLSFGNIVTVVHPIILSSSSAIAHASEARIAFTSANDNAVVGVNGGRLNKAPQFLHSSQLPTTSKGKQGDAESSLCPSSSAELEIVFGTHLKKSQSPLLETPSDSFQASSLVFQFPVTDEGQGLTAPIFTPTPSLNESSSPEKSSRSSSPDLIQFTPPKKSLPKKESPKVEKFSQIHVSKLNPIAAPRPRLNSTSSPFSPRIPGDLKTTTAFRCVDPFRAKPKILRSAIKKIDPNGSFQEILGKDITQPTLGDKLSLTRIAVMELPTVPHAGDATAPMLPFVTSASLPYLTTIEQDIDLIASKQFALSSYPPAHDLILSNSSSKIHSQPTGKDKADFSAAVSSTHLSKVTLPTALATRTTDDVFAELKQPLHVQTSQIQVDTKPGSAVDASDAITKNCDLDKCDLPALEEDDEDEDEEEPNQPVPDIKRISARKQKNADIFDIYLREAEKQPKAVKMISQADEAVQSTRWFIEQAEKQHIISSPRDYQLELFERAKKQNIIAVLDTGTHFPLFFLQTSLISSGSGKTFIAVLLLRYIIDQELEDRAIGKPKRVSFFLVGTYLLLGRPKLTYKLG